MLQEVRPAGKDWHNSYEKRVLDANLARETRVLALWITHNTLQILEPTQIFTQERIGLGGRLFPMIKVQTMDSLNEPLLSPKKLSVMAQIVRRLAFDELVQVVHVSQDPENPKEMSIIGPRPQQPAEIEHMYKTMSAAGQEERFYAWYQAYVSMRPGIFGPDSFIGERFQPSTLEYYNARVDATFWYQDHGDEATDIRIFGTMLAVGSHYMSHDLPKMLGRLNEIPA